MAPVDPNHTGQALRKEESHPLALVTGDPGLQWGRKVRKWLDAVTTSTGALPMPPSPGKQVGPQDINSPL